MSASGTSAPQPEVTLVTPRSEGTPPRYPAFSVTETSRTRALSRATWDSISVRVSAIEVASLGVNYRYMELGGQARQSITVEAHLAVPAFFFWMP